jgi:ABC-2 type transport system permease protein
MEYTRRIKTKGFVFGVISMPMIILLSIGLGFVSQRMQSNPLPIGYIDFSGVFNQAAIPSDSFSFPVEPVEMKVYSNLEQGKQDVVSREIQALFAITSDYLQSGKVEVFVAEKPGENAYSRMRDFLRKNLIAGETKEISERLRKGNNLTIISLDGSQKLDGRNWLSILFPFVFILIFTITINISGSYLMQSVVDEKENRTIEVIVSSVSSNQLMVGKILANLGVGLTQLFIWLLFTALGLLGLEMIIQTGVMPNLEPIHLLLLFGILAPGTIFIAALMTMAGVTVAELYEAQQVSILFTLPMLSPIWFSTSILSNPDKPLSIFLSIFPLTAIVTMPIRASFTSVPEWQLALAVIVLWSSAILALALAAKVFRISMLSYGKRLSVKDLIYRLGKNAQSA